MFVVFGFYKFKQINNLNINKKLLNNLLFKKNIKGTIIISREGINGSLSGKNKDLNETIRKIKITLKFKKFNSFNKSKSKFQPFHKPKIKIKKELVPMTLNMKNESQKINNYIEPNKWNKLIESKETFLLDARKPFENKVGSFINAFNPNVDNFRDFPKYLKRLKKQKPIAMFCTGGIRCEKASVFLKKKGFENVYQLKGCLLYTSPSPRDSFRSRMPSSA